MKVLVVDDNPIVRAGLSAVLERTADVSEIFEAENAFTALEMATLHSRRSSCSTFLCRQGVLVSIFFPSFRDLLQSLC